MKINTAIEMSFKCMPNNKKRHILIIITIFILSLIMMSILWIGIGSYKNIEKAKYIYAKNNEISISISNINTKEGIIALHNSSMINKFTYFSSYSGICLINFDRIELDLLEISDSRETNANSNDILISYELEDEYNIGDTFVLEDNSYIVAGYLGENSSFSYAIDFTYNYKKYNIKNFSILYSYSEGDNLSSYMNALEKLGYMAKEYFEDNQLSMDNLISYKNIHDYSTIIIVVCIAIAIISMLATVGILYNSISIYIDQSKRLLTIFKTYGMSKKGLILHNYFSIIICTMISTLIATILLICALPLYKMLGNQFTTLFDNGTYYIIKSNFTFSASFYWYIPILNIAVYAIVLYILVMIKTGKIYSKHLNELYIETME